MKEASKRGVGGAARRLITGGPGSSPGVSIKETRINVLRRMLRERDRELSWIGWIGAKTVRREKLDAERRAIRERIKELARDTKETAPIRCETGNNVARPNTH